MTGPRPIDLLHLGREQVICCYELGGVLVDPGPESCLPRLLEALGDAAPRAILLTHIHLDHAGATGSLVRRFPELEVVVHEVGAPHVVDPGRLLRSAERIYGDEMERLWGEVLPVPEANLRVVRGGETVHGCRVAYTPGHASHHVAYLHAESGTAFAGDVAGVRIAPSDVILPPTPPPDIDLPLWERSVETLRAWRASALALTHFGLFDEVEQHLDAVVDELRRLEAMDASRGRQRFLDDVEARLATAGDLVATYAQAAPADQLWLGLERYWRKRDEARASAQPQPLG